MKYKEFTLYKQAREDLTLIRGILSIPFIYGMAPILIVFDIFLEIYHQVAFRLYRIPIVKRSDFIFIDRHKSKKLNLIQKINCVYCGYANGLLRYASKIAAITEKYWCPMKHQNAKSIKAQPHQKNFIDFE